MQNSHFQADFSISRSAKKIDSKEKKFAPSSFLPQPYYPTNHLSRTKTTKIFGDKILFDYLCSKYIRICLKRF